MARLECFLWRQGYSVLNIDYPSRLHDIPELAAMVRGQIMANVQPDAAVHVVAHSLGGILIRYIQSHDPIPNLGRVVMLGPPNQGSEVVDRLGDLPFFETINGRAGGRLGTDPDGIARRLGPVNFALGVLAGDRSLNWVLSMIIPGSDDGKVSIERARVDGMLDFKIVHATHPFMMRNPKVMREVACFLRRGHFMREPGDKNL